MAPPIRPFLAPADNRAVIHAPSLPKIRVGKGAAAPVPSGRLAFEPARGNAYFMKPSLVFASIADAGIRL